MKSIFLDTRNLKNEKFNFFLLKSKYPNLIQNNRTRTKNIQTRPKVQKYPNEFSIHIPKYSKIRNTLSESKRVSERPLLLMTIISTLEISKKKRQKNKIIGKKKDYSLSVLVRNKFVIYILIEKLFFIKSKKYLGIIKNALFCFVLYT